MPGVRLPVNVIFKKALKASVLAKRAVDAADRVLKSESFAMERDMKRNAPVGVSGDLRSHVGTVGPIKTTGFGGIKGQLGLFGSGVIYEVGVRGLRYPQFIEFGTGPAGAATVLLPVAKQAMEELGYVHGPGDFMPPLNVISRWLKRKGLSPDLAWPVARAIGRRGIKPHPFVFPAFAKRAPGIPGKVSSAVAKILEAS